MAQATSNTISWKLKDLLKFHLTDWVFTGVLVALEIFLNWIHPHERYVGEWMFVTGELRYPFKPETVPYIFLPVIALVVPMIFIVSYYVWGQNIQDLHNSTLGLFTAVLLTGVIADAIKSGVGRPRPHFYAQCFGSTTAIAVTVMTCSCVFQTSLLVVIIL
jgi:diacylglycerol diphosphate phosphatase/phosphatidate phosphatase